MRLTRHLWVLFFLIKLALSSLPASADTGTGIAWLNQAAAPGGGYESLSVATTFQATAESLNTFVTVGQPAQPGVNAALGFLAAESYANTENLSRRIETLGQYGADVTTLIATLETHQNRDGGFGELPGYGSTPLDTAFALRVLASRASSNAVKSDALFYLAAQQNADGGFSLSQGQPSSPYVSALVAMALSANSNAFNVANLLSAIRDFLIDCIDTSGAVSDIWQSSLALIAIAPLTTNTAVIQPLIDFIDQSQAANGSWDNDVYQTGLALQALHIAASTVVADPTLASLTGVVTDRATGAPLNGATVILNGGVLGSSMTDASGRYEFGNLPVETISVQVQAPGYLTSVTSAALASTGLFTLDVTLQADRSPLPLDLTGVVIDLSSGQPLAAANLVVQQTGDTTTSDVAGVFTFSGIPAGSLTVVISAGGYANTSIAVSAPLGGSIDLGSIGLVPFAGNPTLGSVQGTVRDAENGNLLANVAVSLSGENAETVYTDAAGQFFVTDLVPGDISISAVRSGFYPGGATGTVVAGGVLVANLELVAEGVAAGISIEGLVIDRETFLPLAGAVISVSGTGGATQSDANGNFYLSTVAGGQIEITISLTGYLPAIYTATVGSGGVLNLGTIRLVAEGSQPTNEDPVITSVAPTDATVGFVYGYQVTATDADNDPLAFALVEGPVGMTIGTTTGLIEWVPELPQAGTANVTVSVADDQGGQALQSFVISIAVGFGRVYTVTDVETLNQFTVDDIVPENYTLGTYFSGTNGATFLADVCTLSWTNINETLPNAVASLDRISVQPVSGQDLILDMGTAYSTITVFPFIDHPPFPEEGIEYTVWGSNDPNAVFPDGWQQGTLVSIYTKGFTVDPICPEGTIETDDFAGLYTFGADSYRYVRTRTDYSISIFFTPAHDTWSSVVDDGSEPGWQSSEGEIDAVGGMECSVPPAIDAGEDIIGIVGEAVQFDASAPGENIVHFGWDFDNDREIDFVGSDATRTFSAGVDSDVTLYAVDDRGCVGVDTVNVRVTVEPARPDLTVSTIDRTSIVTDTNTLATTGFLEATIKNLGSAPTGLPATATAFYDRDQDGDYTNGVDVLLGETLLSDSLAENAEARISIPVSGIANYRDEIVSVKIDSTLVIDEVSETNNVATTAGFCRIAPNPDPTFTISEKWQWFGTPGDAQLLDVFGPPMVGQLTDDNGDGAIDINDTPDLVFGALSNSRHALIAVNGNDGSMIWEYDDIPTNAVGSVAIGDIDSDGFVEIVMENTSRQQLAVLEHDGILKWAVPTGPTFAGFYGSRDAISLVDLDADGVPEILQGRRVFNADGTLRWEGQGDHGGNITYGVIPIAADVDLDGQPDIVAGRTLYDADGNIVWWRTDINGDGFTAVGNFDDDDFAEIVLVASGRVYLLEHTGETIWGPVSIPGGGIGGPPTIADVDADGQPEIGVAGASRYIVLETDGALKWQAVTIDQSSNRTGSSVFDFEDDGRAEVLYADEENFFIFDGESGAELLKLPNNSGTTFEYPVVVDLDNDNEAEIVLVSSQTGFTPPGGGVRVLESGGEPWAPTRSIWNQHAYSINNVNDDGTIPSYQEPSWLTHNTFRLNTFADRDAGAIADLTAALLGVSTPQAGQPATISLRVGNAGAITADNVTVSVYQGEPGSGGVLLGTVSVGSLGVGAFQDVSLTGVTTLTGTDTIVAIVDADQLLVECDETNNRVRTEILLQSSVATIDVSTTLSTYPAGSDVPLNALVSNTTGVPGEFLYQMRVEDSEGNPIEVYVQKATGTLAANSSIGDAELWTSGAVLAGIYRLRGSVFGTNGTLLAEDIATFAIASDPTDPANNVDAGTQILTDKQTYAPFDAIHMTARARNLTNNAILPPTIGTVTLSDSSGGLLFAGSVAYGELTPNALADRPLISAFIDAQAGDYVASLSLVDAATGTVLATDSTTVSVVRPATTGLTGTVTAAYNQVERGTDNVCTYDVRNVSAQAISGLTLNLRIVDFVTGDEVSVESVLTSLAGGTDQRLVRTVPTTALLSDTYACLFDAEVASDAVQLGGAPFDITEPPIQLTANLDTLQRSRLLVLLDEAPSESDENCDGVTALTLQSDFPYGLASDAVVTVDLYKGSSDWKDSESTTLAGFPGSVDQNDGGRSNIAIVSLDSGQIEVEVNTGGSGYDKIENEYSVVVTAVDANGTQTRMSTPVHTSCSKPINVGDVHGDFSISAVDKLVPWPGCDGLAGVGLALGPIGPLTADAQVSVYLFKKDDELIDQETVTFGTAQGVVDESPGNDKGNLVIRDVTNDSMRVLFAGEGLSEYMLTRQIGSVVDGDFRKLDSEYSVGASITSGGSTAVFDTGPIHTSCSQPIGFGDNYGPFVLDDIAELPDDSDDPGGPDFSLNLGEQRQFLENFLASNGWSYTIVEDKEDFERALYTGEFGSYLLLAENIYLDDKPEEVLREAIFRGEGLVVFPGKGKRNEKLEEAMGVKAEKYTDDASAVDYTDSILHGAGTVDLVLPDKVWRLELQGATSLASYVLEDPEDHNNALTRYEFGSGKAVTGGFDWLAQTSIPGGDPNADHETLMQTALSYVQASAHDLNIGSVVPVRLTIENLGIATPGVAEIEFPPEYVIVDPAGLPVDMNNGLTWVFELETDEIAERVVWIRLPANTGTIEATVLAGIDPELVEQLVVSLELAPQADPEFGPVVTLLTSLIPISNHFEHALDDVLEAEEKLADGDAENALDKLLDAVDELKKAEAAEADDVRFLVAYLIRSVARQVHAQ